MFLFFVGCHSEANLGYLLGKSLKPSKILWPEQYGQFAPRITLATSASKSCSHPNRQSSFCWLPKLTCVAGIKELGETFLAISGCVVAKSLKPSRTALPEQYLQPLPLFLLPTSASHVCPHLPSHQTLVLELTVTSVGFRVPFSVGCHSAARD